MKWKSIFLIAISAALCFCASPQKKIEKERAKNPRYQYNVGIFYLNNGQMDKAKEYLDKALDLQPNFDLALDGLGLVYFMQRQFPEAIASFEKALRSNPKLTDARNHLGTVYQEIGQLDKAESEFQTASEDMTYHSRELPFYNLSRLYFIKEDFQTAMDFVNQALIINPRMVLALNLQGILYENLQKFPQAVDSYRRAIKINPDDITLKYNLAGALFKNEEYTQAESLFREIQPMATSEEMQTNIAKYLDMLEKRKKNPA
jgi:Tfp pilus assembly protein PilF